MSAEHDPSAVVIPPKFQTVKGIQQRLHRMYEPRNRQYMTQTDRIDFLSRGVRNFREDHTNQHGNIAVAHERVAIIVARVAAVAVSAGVQLHQGLSKKYPENGCARCFSIPCRCDLNGPKPEPILGEFSKSSSQASWGLNRYQLYFEQVYGHKNRQHHDPLGFAFSRLADEVEELRDIQTVEIPKHTHSHYAIQEMFELEAADVVARTLAICNLIGVNAEAAVFARYGGKCLSCGQSVCDCRDNNLHDARDPRNLVLSQSRPPRLTVVRR